jgi:hypothetical protein
MADVAFLRYSARGSLAVLIFLAACSQASVSPEPTDSTASSSSASEGADATELTASADPLPAGRYTRSEFRPPVTLELDGTWYGVQLHDGFFDVQQDPGSPDVIAVQFAAPTGVYGADGIREYATTVEAAAAAIRANPGLTVLGESPSRMGGLEGIVLVVENAGDAHVSVLAVPPGPLGIDPGRRLWIALFDTSDGLLSIMVGGSVARWDEALAAAEPVLESILIGD